MHYLLTSDHPSYPGKTGNLVASTKNHLILNVNDDLVAAKKTHALRLKYVGNDLLKKTVNFLIDNPKKWDRRYEKSSASDNGCFISWCYYFATGKVTDNGMSLEFPICRILNISGEEFWNLYNEDATFNEIYSFVTSRLGKDNVRKSPKDFRKI